MVKVLSWLVPGQPVPPEATGCIPVPDYASDTGTPPQPGTGSPVPGPAGTEAESRYSAAGEEIPAPLTGAVASTAGGTQDLVSTAMQKAGDQARAQAAALCRSACVRLLRHLNTPGTMAHAAWHYRPLSLAAHHEQARSRSWVPENGDKNGAYGRWGEFTLHAVGRPLKIAGNALHALGESPAGIWAAGAVLLIAGLTFWVLVINPR